MNVTFALSSLWLNGGNRVITQYANHLVTGGYRVTMVVPGGSIESEMASALDERIDVRVTRAKIRSNANNFEKLNLTAQMAGTIPKSNLVIATHTPTVPAVLIAANMFRRGRPVWLYQDSIGMFPPRSIEEWLQRNALRFLYGAMVISEQAQKDFQARYPNKPVYFVGEGISEDFINWPALKEDCSLRESGKRYVLIMGDSRPRKGMVDALKAAEIVAQQIPELHLWVVSKEPVTPETSIPYTYYYRPERPQLAALYGSCDVFAFTSWNESFGLPGLEAMACGAPVVLTDSIGVRTYAVPGENCLMTPVQATAEIAESILRILQQPELAHALQEAGMGTAKKFTWEQAFQRLDQNIERLAGNGDR